LRAHRAAFLGKRPLRPVWGQEMRAGDRSVDVYVRKLDVKL
jgi:DNA-binding response OmpR family regulator